ncbi:unnamed protein product [Lupinus luteus]|uniref:indole-3-pyruvate monooxygenase n=1 Tax=Lupinus luteus TaxID=3873 RepID=A0AAV1W816_LUPLU
MEDFTVTIVGGGPSGLAISACLKQNSISHVILEKEDCNASLWRKNAYDRLNLHLAKEFCYLPFMPHSSSCQTFLTKAQFLQYLDRYAAHFNINPRCCRTVESAAYDGIKNKWRVEAKNTKEDKLELYESKFLVIATGENNEPNIPDNIPGLKSFEGEMVHTRHYKSGGKYKSKQVLVVGSGNTGMEIAYDLCNYGANTSILIRSPEITGRSPVLDVGTIKKIREGAIKVIPSNISRIKNKKVVFGNGLEKEFDEIVFATGYKSMANNWLKDYNYALNDNGFPKNAFPNHWKGENGLYCAGLSRRGLFGVRADAEAITEDINQVHKKHNTNDFPLS